MTVFIQLFKFQQNFKMYQLTNSTTIIRISDTASIPPDPANSDYAAYLAWIAEGNTPEPYVPPPVDMVAEITKAMDALFDVTAQSKHYDNRITCTLRAGYPGPFQAEGIAFASWMDAQNAKAYQMLARVEDGTMPMPATIDEALSLLDPMVWP